MAHALDMLQGFLTFGRLTMHFCHEEVFMLMQALPGLRLLVAWLRSKLTPQHKCACDGESHRKVLYFVRK